MRYDDPVPAPHTLQYVDANGLRFAYIAEGEGPLALLLHGFPDTPHTPTSSPVHRAASRVTGGHFMHLEHPDVFAERLLKHL
jgi:pimeloyl-ACP methyl ester carboxylesterase